MLRKLGGIWLVLVMALSFVLGVSGLAVAAPGLGGDTPVAEGGSGSGADADADDAGTGDADGQDPDGSDSSDDDPDSEPDPEPVVTASVSPDEKVVSLLAKDPSLANATRVVFHVWAQNGGKASLIEHEAVQREDGSWVATAFIASSTFDDPGVPYNCRVVDAVHRLYNPYTQQHLFTSDLNEADVLSRGGWRYEGIAWVQPQKVAAKAVGVGAAPVTDSGADAFDSAIASDEAVETTDPAIEANPEAVDPAAVTPDAAEALTTASQKPVYRLLNPNSGDHLFTLNRAEYDSLGANGWQKEGVAFTSDASEGMEVYRVFNPYLSIGSHLFTSSANEYRTLVANGWRDEGVAWYGDVLNADGTWCAQAQNRYHNDSGTYHVEAIATVVPTEPEAPVDSGDEPATDPSTDPTTDPTPETSTTEGGAEALATSDAAPQQVKVGETTFAISRPSASVHVENVDNARGTYDVVVTGVRSASGVAHVQVPTWTDRGGQDDIVWYEAARQGDGSYRATVSVGRHSFEHDFTSDVYVKTGNGIMANMGRINQYLSLANFIRKSGGPYLYKVSIFNPGPVARVQMPTWSDQGGQDDIVWFDARDQGDGWWTATIDASRLLHSGTVHIHVYADGQFRGAVPDFTIQPWEILEWRYRNMNERIWNLSSPTDWLLAVDTSNCFVGVYRGSRGSWANQHWWDCAPGTAATPTVKGIFSIGSRGSSFGHGYTCYWWTQFYGDYWFHSIKYYEGTYNVLDGTLGAPASLGCVRLAIGNAKWIHDNIPSGTTVLVY